MSFYYLKSKLLMYDKGHVQHVEQQTITQTTLNH